MSERRVTFKSDNLDIAGVVRVPDGFAAGERRPAFIVLHGFGSNMNSESVREPCQLFDGLGYVGLRFDMRGCGDSGGGGGRGVWLGQGTATQKKHTYLSQWPAGGPARPGSFGRGRRARVARYS